MICGCVRRRKCDDVDKFLLEINAFSKVFFCMNWSSCLGFVEVLDAQNAMTSTFFKSKARNCVRDSDFYC